MQQSCLQKQMIELCSLLVVNEKEPIPYLHQPFPAFKLLFIGFGRKEMLEIKMNPDVFHVQRIS